MNTKHFAPCGFRHRKTYELKTCLQGDECDDPLWEDIYFLCDCGEPEEGCIEIPEPMKPMTGDDIHKATEPYMLRLDARWKVGFETGVRFAERHHGIGASDD